MVEPIKPPSPAASSGGEIKSTDQSTQAAPAGEAKTGDQAAPKVEATPAPVHDPKAKEAADKAAAQAAEDAKTQEEAARLKAEQEKKDKQGKGSGGEVKPPTAEETKAAEEAAQLAAKAAREALRKTGVTLPDPMLDEIEGFKDAEGKTLDDTLKAAVIRFDDARFKRQQEAYNKAQESWISELQASKEFGGTRFKQTTEGARRVFVKFCDKEDLEMIDRSGLGNHKAFVKTFARIHRALMGDDTYVKPGNGNNQVPVDPKKVLFGSDTVISPDTQQGK